MAAFDIAITHEFCGDHVLDDEGYCPTCGGREQGAKVLTVACSCGSKWTQSEAGGRCSACKRNGEPCADGLCGECWAAMEQAEHEIEADASDYAVSAREAA